jgi:alpha-galactosidase
MIPHGRACRALLLLCLVLLPRSAARAQAIVSEQDPARWTIQTDNSAYQVMVTRDGTLAPVYYGPHAGGTVPLFPERRRAADRERLPQVVPYRGGFVDMTPMLEAVLPDGTRELELRYAGHETGELDGRPYIRFDLKDTHYAFEVSAFVRVHTALDILEQWLVVRNTGNAPLTLERVYSGSVLLPPGDYDLLHLSGDWGREFVPRRTQLTSGVKSLAIRTMKSPQHPPVALVRPRGDHAEHEGPVWFAQVAWSGNWQIDAEVTRIERTYLAGGINFWDTTWRLAPGEAFETPRMIVGVAIDGPGGASRRMHRYILDSVLPRPGATVPSRVLYNSWYATEFDVNEEDQVALARIARDLGVELFVMDDGWFKGRVNDRAGLGDWTVDPKKFPNGLGSLIRRVNELGLDFGLWVEPEMVSPDSDLYRSRPEWSLRSPHRQARVERHQLVLNFAREDVKQFTIEWLDRLLSENRIAFVKWDMNRHVSEASWPEAPPEQQRELRIRYVRNLYEVLDTLRRKHPHVLFESCSSGGGRVDLGILARTDQFWTSDNTNAPDRLIIQHGASYAFPAKAMVNWVTDNHWPGAIAPLKFRFHVAMAGNVGVGNNLHTLTNEERALAREQIALYKQVRDIIQFGDQYRLGNPLQGGRSGVQFVTRAGDRSVVFAYQPVEGIHPVSPATVSPEPNTAPGPTTFVLRGLDPARWYRLGTDVEPIVVSGRGLMTSGLPVTLRGSFASAVITITAVPPAEAPRTEGALKVGTESEWE